MRRYNSQNINKLYISPYIRFKKNKTEIICFNYVMNTMSIIKLSEDIFVFLEDGMEYFDLIEKLESYTGSIDEAEKLVKNMIKRGIIE